MLYLCSRAKTTLVVVWIVAWFVLLLAPCRAAVSQSKKATTTNKNQPNSLLPPNNDGNQLWPSGISSRDVEHLVEQVMGDPNFNIGAIPDSLEKSIYRSVIRLVFNAVYHSLGNLHGQQWMGHEFKTYRWRHDVGGQKITDAYQVQVDSQDLNDEVLSATVYRLLSNKAINQRFVPDLVERQLYLNCLKLVFRLLAMIAASLKVTVCGHSVKLDISRAPEVLEPAVQRAAISLSAIGRARVDELAAQAGFRHDRFEDEDDPVKEHRSERGWWQQWMARRRRAFLLRLHASLWGLILGIIDDLLAHTRIELLSDYVTVDIVPIKTASLPIRIVQHSMLVPALWKIFLTFVTFLVFVAH